MAVWEGARFHVKPNASFSLRRWTSMKLTVARYEFPPVTMERMENSSTCGSLYICPCPRTWIGHFGQAKSSSGAKAVMATSESVAASGVRDLPIRESCLRSVSSLYIASVASWTQVRLQRSVEQPWPPGRVRPLNPHSR
jgi:hypothetical protein